MNHAFIASPALSTWWSIIVNAVKNNCADWFQSGYKEDGLYQIDPDGDGPEGLMNVTCENMQGPDSPTAIHHNFPFADIGYGDGTYWIWDMIYYNVTNEQITQLLLLSSYCQMEAEMYCQNADLAEAMFADKFGGYNYQVQWLLCEAFPDCEYNTYVIFLWQNLQQ